MSDLHKVIIFFRSPIGALLTESKMFWFELPFKSNYAGTQWLSRIHSVRIGKRIFYELCVLIMSHTYFSWLNFKKQA